MFILFDRPGKLRAITGQLQTTVIVNLTKAGSSVGFHARMHYRCGRPCLEFHTNDTITTFFNMGNACLVIYINRYG